MKAWCRIGLKTLATLGLLVIGSMPLLIGLVAGMAIRRLGLALALALALTALLISGSALHPDLFRFGPTGLSLHDTVAINGVPSLPASAGCHLLWAALGGLIGHAARDGYRQARRGSGSSSQAS